MDVRFLVHLLVRDEVKFGDVLAVSVGLDAGYDLPPFVIVPVGKFVACDDHLHAKVGEEVLVVVAPRSADNGKGSLALQDFPILVEDRPDPRGLPLDDLFGLTDNLLVAEDLRDLA